ncbi:MAG: DUF2785 domain-containing protein [Ktedonobacteraceae bacterium]
MDKMFWQSIIDNEYAIPPEASVAALTPELLSYLGSVDPELREETTYAILDAWIHRGYYSHAELWKIATRLLHHLTIGLGEQQSDTIFWRSFSLLILTEIIYHDLTHPTLSEIEVRLVLEQALAYFEDEQDLRGYDIEKGWMHAIAHAADLLWVLAQHRDIATSDLSRIMDALAEKITAPVAHVYLYGEEERLVRTVMGVLQRDLLTLPSLATWLELLTHPRGRIAWSESFEGGKMMDVVRSEAETCARHNTKYFLCSLYFQLRSPGFAHLTFVEQRPAVADALLPLIENALSQIRAWC